MEWGLCRGVVRIPCSRSVEHLAATITFSHIKYLRNPACFAMSMEVLKTVNSFRITGSNLAR